jgi:PKD repeat protein
MPNISFNLRTLTLGAMMAVSAANAQDLALAGGQPHHRHRAAVRALRRHGHHLQERRRPRQVLYTFDYGDSAAGSWSTTGKARGLKAGGPIGAFVFERPGTYTVRLIASDGRHSDERRITITVLDPNIVYAGAATVCIATDGSTGWGPAGASYVNAIPDKSTWHGKRLIFQARPGLLGEHNVVITRGAANFQLCAGPGAGAKPILPVVSIGATGRPPAPTPGPTTSPWWISTSRTATASAPTASTTSRLRCDIPMRPSSTSAGRSTPCSMTRTSTCPSTSGPVPKYHALVDCTMPGDQVSTTYNLFSDACSHAAILGCTMSQPCTTTWRARAYKTLVADNQLKGQSPSSSYHCLKVHGGSFTPYAEPLTAASKFWATRYVVAQHNIIGSPECHSWLSAFSPQNGSSVEGVQDILVLDNTFIRSGVGQVDVIMGGSRITVMDNTTQGGDFTSSVGHDESLPAEWKGPYFTSRGERRHPMSLEQHLRHGGRSRCGQLKAATGMTHEQYIEARRILVAEKLRQGPASDLADHQLPYARADHDTGTPAPAAWRPPHTAASIARGASPVALALLTFATHWAVYHLTRQADQAAHQVDLQAAAVRRANERTQTSEQRRAAEASLAPAPPRPSTP